jgi:hypothetical protein
MGTEVRSPIIDDQPKTKINKDVSIDLLKNKETKMISSFKTI